MSVPEWIRGAMTPEGGVVQEIQLVQSQPGPYMLGGDPSTTRLIYGEHGLGIARENPYQPGVEQIQWLAWGVIAGWTEHRRAPAGRAAPAGGG